MVSNLSDLGVELFVRIVQLYHAFTWKNVHPLARKPGAEQTVLGLAAKRWLPTPSKAFIATLADFVEERKDPAFLRDAAAMLQRVAIADPKFKKHFLELATHVQELARFEPGCNQLAMHTADELDVLLAAPEEGSTLADVLGEGHCHPVDLLVVTWSRLLAKRGSRRDLLTVMGRLRTSGDALILADPELSEKDKQRKIRGRSDQELLLFGHRVAGHAWEVDDLAELRVKLYGSR